MRTRINMPRLGESLVEGTVGRWLKREGDFVAEYEPLLEVITDKIDSEIPSPAEGVLLRILVDEGETVAVGTPLAEIGAPGADMDVAGDSVAAEADTVSRAEVPAALRSGRLSPVVARLLAEHGLDAAAIPGSGRGGRLTRKDVEAWLARSSSAAPDVPGELRPLTAMRRSIAVHMVRERTDGAARHGRLRGGHERGPGATGGPAGGASRFAPDARRLVRGGDGARA